MRLRNTPYSAALLACFFALSVTSLRAQRQDPDALATTQTDPRSSTAPLTPEELAIMDRYLTSVQAEAATRIDTKSAADGQAIVMRVTQNTTLADGTPLPKGTKLTGHILRAQSYQKDHSAAMLAISIDRAELPGRSLPIRCVIRALGSANSLSADVPMSMPPNNAGAPMLNPLGSTMDNIPLSGPNGSISADSTTGANPNGSRGSAGNRGIPTSSANVPSITNGSAGIPIPSGDPGLGSPVTNPALGPTTAIPAATVEAPVIAAGEHIHDAPRRTRLPGVMLSGTGTVGVSGVLSSLDRNITLDSNTHITFGVIATGH
ncbi:MAG TPA: hypothetical protein VG714_06035 [Acidobacteriaceae bacterium]|nr:hypothetical protein [Acidobacteriaceae bacterium]